MCWRNHATHREESKAVKDALRRRGIRARVGHDRGTAWAWLTILVSREYCDTVRRQVLGIAQTVTGRHGEYDGQILVTFERRATP